MASIGRALSDTLVIDAFALRNWPLPAGIGPLQVLTALLGNNFTLKDGYAPFCKHIFLPCEALNDEKCLAIRTSYARITPQNRMHLESDYIARSSKELPVLTRYFSSKNSEASLGEQATHLDCILYSRQQVIAENTALKGQQMMPNIQDSIGPYNNLLSSEMYEQGKWEWAVISIKPQIGDSELPMLPITAMRNAVGKAEGGSGVPIDREAYMRAVEFWRQHAQIL